MAWSFVLTWQDTTTSDISAYVKKNSVKKTFSKFGDDFKSNRNSLSFDFRYDSTIVSKLFSNNIVKCKVQFNGVDYFTGIVEARSEINVKNILGFVTLKLTDNSYFLDQKRTTALQYTNKYIHHFTPSNSIFYSICNPLGLTFSTSLPSRISTLTIPRFFLDTTDDLWTQLVELCYSNGFAFFFKENGEIEFIDLYANGTPTITIDDGANPNVIDGSLKFSRKKVDYGSIRVQWDLASSQKNANIAEHWFEPYPRPDGAAGSDPISTATLSSWQSWAGWSFPNYALNVSNQVKILDNFTINYKAFGEKKYLGAENISFDCSISGWRGSSPYSLYNSTFLTFDSANSFTKFWRSTGGQTSANWSVSVSANASSATVSLYDNNPNLDSVTLRTFGKMTVNGTAWYLEKMTDLTDINSANKKEQVYKPKWANSKAQAESFLNFAKDVRDNRTWTAIFDSYTSFTVGSFVALSVKGVSLTGVIYQSDYNAENGRYSYKIQALSNVTISANSNPAVVPGVLQAPSAVDKYCTQRDMLYTFSLLQM